MRTFKTKRLDRWARKEGLADKVLWEAAEEVANGNVEASLGQCLFKKRIARPDGGKRSGFRTIVAFKNSSSDNVFFVYGFAKSGKSNITCVELDVLGTVAKHYMEASNAELEILIKNGSLFEVEEVHGNE